MTRLAYILIAAAIAAAGCGNCSGPGESPGELRHGSQPRLETPTVDPDNRAQHRENRREFSFDLLRRVVDHGEDENVVVSPYSIATSMAKLYAGAGGQTRREIADALRFELDDDELHRAFNELDIRLATHARHAGFRFDHADAIIVDEDADIRHAYLNVLTHHYGDGVHDIELSAHAEASRQAINRWIAGHTRHGIVDLFDPNAIDENASLLVANSAHLSAPWLYEFDVRNSAVAPFTTLDGSAVNTTLMFGDESYRFFDDQHTTAAAIPFGGANLFFIALMPAESDADFSAWEKHLDSDHFAAVVDDLSGLEKGELHLPKFELHSTHDLRSLLTEMGLQSAFDPEHADFSNLYAEDDEPLAAAAHGASLKIGERGAGTAPSKPGDLDDAIDTGRSDEPKLLRFDRPFYFAVYDEGAQVILLAGRITDPGDL